MGATDFRGAFGLDIIKIQTKATGEGKPPVGWGSAAGGPLAFALHSCQGPPASRRWWNQSSQGRRPDGTDFHKVTGLHPKAIAIVTFAHSAATLNTRQDRRTGREPAFASGYDWL
jgi:hypothetical protein